MYFSLYFSSSLPILHGSRCLSIEIPWRLRTARIREAWHFSQQTKKNKDAEKPPKVRKPESMIRLLPQFPSQLKIHLMLEKINSVIIIIKKKVKSDFYHQVWLESDSLLAHKAPGKKKTQSKTTKQKKPHTPPTSPCPQKNRRAKLKFIWLETIRF